MRKETTVDGQTFGEPKMTHAATFDDESWIKRLV